MKVHLYKSFDTEKGPKSRCGKFFSEDLHPDYVLNETEFAHYKPKAKKCISCQISQQKRDKW